MSQDFAVYERNWNKGYGPSSVAATDFFAQIYFVTITLASLPRPSLTSEEKYFTAEHGISKAYDLPCWASHWSKNHCAKKLTANETIEPAEVHITVVIPAYNEEERLKPMLDEAIPYLDKHYGRAPLEQSPLKNQTNHVSQVNLNGPDTTRQRSHKPNGSTAKGGYEILIVDDGSKDDTVNLALRIAASHGLGDTFRVIKLKHNRGKGGAVTHGMRHARGEYVLFADADGASEFSDVAKLIKACKDIEDDYGRGIAIGSRAHMVGQDAVIQVSQYYLVCTLSDVWLICIAICSSKSSDALLPLPTLVLDSNSHISHQGHPVRLQAIQSPISATHHSLHDSRRLDFRRGNAHAGRECATNRKG